MPCFVALIALFAPRIVIAGLYFLSDWFDGLFASILWPLLGFLFAPFTLLWYSVVVKFYGGEWGLLQIAGLILALALDFSPGLSKRQRRK